MSPQPWNRSVHGRQVGGIYYAWIVESPNLLELVAATPEVLGPWSTRYTLQARSGTEQDPPNERTWALVHNGHTVQVGPIHELADEGIARAGRTLWVGDGRPNMGSMGNWDTPDREIERSMHGTMRDTVGDEGQGEPTLEQLIDEARSAGEEGDFHAALNAADQALEMDPENAEAARYYMLSLVMVGRLDDALAFTREYDDVLELVIPRENLNRMIADLQERTTAVERYPWLPWAAAATAAWIILR